MANLWLIVANWMLARCPGSCGRGAPASALGGPDRHKKWALLGDRTRDIQIRSLALCPAELVGQ